MTPVYGIVIVHRHLFNTTSDISTFQRCSKPATRIKHFFNQLKLNFTLKAEKHDNYVIMNCMSENLIDFMLGALGGLGLWVFKTSFNDNVCVSLFVFARGHQRI